MTKELVEKLWERQAELKQQIRTIESELGKINALLALYVKPEEAIRTPKTTSERAVVSRAIADGKHNDKEVIIKAVEDILKAANGQPILREALLAELGNRGVTIRGVDPANVLTTILWRAKKRFTHIRGVGYTLVKD